MRFRIAVAAVFLLLLPGSAHAASGTFSCANLQAALQNVANDDVITLDSSDGPGGLCDQSYTLPVLAPNGFGDPVRWTLIAKTQGVDGFDGTTPAGRVLTGVDSHYLTIQGLVFRDSDAATNGGAISLTGDTSAALFSNTFVNNHATSGKGGAVYMSPEEVGVQLPGVSVRDNTFESNSAQTGGALAVETVGLGQNPSYGGNTFTGNVASHNGGAFSWEMTGAGGDNFSLNGNVVRGNKASGFGGGGYVLHTGGGALRVDNELYDANSIDPAVGTPPTNSHFGGGLYVEHNSISILRNNRFTGNSVMSSPTGEGYGGGGLAMDGDSLDAQSVRNTFVGNSVAGQPDGSGFESEGGGLFFSGEDSTWDGFLDAYAANSVGALGKGGGIYVGAVAGTTLDLADSTVVGNTVGAGGQYAGLAGDGPDHLFLSNSIVWNANGEPDTGGFATRLVLYTDACLAQGAPYPGPGNICADPKLANPAAGDIHQTKLSPTIDKGNDELFKVQAENPDRDFEGDPRPTDGDGDGHSVDMGADESPAGFIAVAPPQPFVPSQQQPQCSDGVDNDSDGAVDRADPGCLSGADDSYDSADANEGDEGLQDLFLCGKRQISLVRADVQGNRVALSGIVGESVANQRVELSVRYLKSKRRPESLGTVRADRNGLFKARVKRPPNALFTVARYRAKIGKARSVELKLPQSLASTSLRSRPGGMLEVRGQVDRTLLGKRRHPVVIKRIVCGRYRTVGQATPNASGVYVVRFAAPAIASAALYRAETKVLARPGSKRFVRQFARALGITF